MTAAAKPEHIDARMRARRARVHADSVRRRQRRTVSLFVLLLVVAGAAVSLRSSLFDITGVRVVGVTGDRVATVERIAALERGQHLLTAPLGEAARRVEALPWVRRATVRRAPPSTVAIAVEPRQPVLTLRTADASWQVDDEVVLVDGGRVRGAPVVAVGAVALPALGRAVDEQVVRDAVEVHTGLPAWLRRQVRAYDVTDPAGLALSLRVRGDGDGGGPTDVTVLFGGARDLALKAEVIRVLLPEAAQRDAALDVRAPANPVVVP